MKGWQRPCARLIWLSGRYYPVQVRPTGLGQLKEMKPGSVIIDVAIDQGLF